MVLRPNARAGQNMPVMRAPIRLDAGRRAGRRQVLRDEVSELQSIGEIGVVLLESELLVESQCPIVGGVYIQHSHA